MNINVERTVNLIYLIRLVRKIYFTLRRPSAGLWQSRTCWWRLYGIGAEICYAFGLRGSSHKTATQLKEIVRFHSVSQVTNVLQQFNIEVAWEIMCCYTVMSVLFVT